MDPRYHPGAAGGSGLGRMLWRGRGSLLAWVIAFAAIALIVNETTAPIYQASIRLEMARPVERSPWTGQVVGAGSFQSENVGLLTTAELITNRVLLGRLAEDLVRRWPDVAADARPTRWPRFSLVPKALARGVAAEVAISPEQRVQWLTRTIHVQPVRDTRLVEIRVEHPSPGGARTIADHLARLFVDYLRERSIRSDTTSGAFIGEQLAAVRQRLETAEAAPALASQGTVVPPGTSAGRMGAAVAEMNRAYLEAKTERMAAGARLARLERSVGDRSDWARLPVESSTLNAMRGALAEREMQLATARGIYKSKHPRLAGLESEVAALDSTIRGELGREVVRLRTEYDVLRARERGLLAAVTEAERDAADGALEETELRADQELYQRLLTSARNRGLEEGLFTPAVMVVEPAAADPFPVRPRKALNFAIFPLVGLVFGAGVVLVRESMRPSLRDPEDVEDQLGLPVVGVLGRRASGGRS